MNGYNRPIANSSWEENPQRPFAIADEDLSTEQRALVERITSGPRKGVPINQLVWMHNIGFANVAERFGAYVSQEAPLTHRCKEICILTVAASLHSELEWYWHERLARESAITELQLYRIRWLLDPEFSDPAERAVFELTRCLCNKIAVEDEAFNGWNAALGRSKLIDLIGLIGLYTMIAHTVALYKVPVPEPTVASQ